MVELSSSAAPGTAVNGLSEDAKEAAASFLGVNELDDLDDAKDRAKPIETKRKLAKLDHDIFFKNPNGLEKLYKTFSKIKFKGKGREFDDLAVLLQSYNKWQQDLYSVGENLEDFALAARKLLSEVKMNEDGEKSFPGEKLYESRHQYKEWELAKKREAATAEQARGAALTEEKKQQIEANRQRALELKRKRAASEIDADAAAIAEMEAAAAAAAAPPTTSSSKAGGGAPQAAAAAASTFFDDEEEDPFGFGGGMDEPGDFDMGRPQQAQAPPPQQQKVAEVHTVATPARVSCFDDEEEEFDDPFGFGGFDMDEA